LKKNESVPLTGPLVSAVQDGLQEDTDQRTGPWHGSFLIHTQFSLHSSAGCHGHVFMAMTENRTMPGLVAGVGDGKPCLQADMAVYAWVSGPISRVLRPRTSDLCPIIADSGPIKMVSGPIRRAAMVAAMAAVVAAMAIVIAAMEAVVAAMAIVIAAMTAVVAAMAIVTAAMENLTAAMALATAGCRGGCCPEQPRLGAGSVVVVAQSSNHAARNIRISLSGCKRYRAVLSGGGARRLA